MPDPRVTQQAVEGLYETDADVRATQQAVEALRSITVPARASQQVAEVLWGPSPDARVSQQVIEILWSRTEWLPEVSTSFGPIVWMEWTAPDGQTYVFGKHVLPDPSTYYGGYKAGRLLSAGPVKNNLADLASAQYEVGRFRVRFGDLDPALQRLVRTMLETDGSE